MVIPYLRPLLKRLVEVLLLIVLFIYFGLPSWEKYQEEKTIVTSVEKDLGGIPAPTITVCAMNSKTQMGYKNDSISKMNFPTSEIIGEICNGLQGKDIVGCAEDATFSRSSVVKRASKGLVGQNDLTKARFWSPEFSYSGNGICYQLEANTTLGTEQETDVLVMEMNTTLSPWIMIHSPQFFVVNSNPGLPMNLIAIDGMTMLTFQLVLHINLPTSSKPCHPDLLYSFTGCIKTSISQASSS